MNYEEIAKINELIEVINYHNRLHFQTLQALRSHNHGSFLRRLVALFRPVQYPNMHVKVVIRLRDEEDDIVPMPEFSVTDSPPRFNESDRTIDTPPLFKREA